MHGHKPKQTPTHLVTLSSDSVSLCSESRRLRMVTGGGGELLSCSRQLRLGLAQLRLEARHTPALLLQLLPKRRHLRLRSASSPAAGSSGFRQTADL